MSRNSRVQAWLAFAIFGVAAGGAFLVLTVSEAVGLYVPPTMARLGKGTFDYIDTVFLVVWALIFQAASIHNGFRYQLILFKVRVPRSRASDVGGLIGFTLIAILWGVLVRTVFAGRAVDPTYISRLPSGVPAASLQAGAQQVTLTYFLVVGLVLVLIVIARFFNPIDFDEYGRYLGRVFRFRSGRTPTSPPASPATWTITSASPFSPHPPPPAASTSADTTRERPTPRTE